MLLLLLYLVFHSRPRFLHCRDGSTEDDNNTQFTSLSASPSQAQIAFLQGERRGQENLKKDLVRRIKMLEFALKQERSDQPLCL